MSRTGHSYFRGAVWLVAVTLLAGEGWWLQHNWRAARTTLASLDQRLQEHQRLATQSPPLTTEGEQAIERDLVNAENTLRELRAEWVSEADAAAVTGPAKSLDAYFDLATYVERARALAAGAQVKTKADECFGFASHVRQGPANELALAVGRQRVGLQYLVEVLIDSRPQALLAVQRERPLTAAQRQQRRQAGGSPMAGTGAATSGQGEDFFALDDRLALRAPGLADSDAFRLEFTGSTRVLRGFLNRLAADGSPAVVRSVEVVPLEAGGIAHASRTLPTSGAPVPLIAPNVSRFAVVVELVELVAGKEALPSDPIAAALQNGPAGTAAVWPAPDGKSSDGWVYEVFTPPAIHYNSTTKSFTVAATSGGQSRVVSPELELLAVKLAPYPLQLTGYFGAPGGYVATFSSADSAEVHFARVGHRFDKLGLRLVDFQVKKVPVQHDDLWPVHDVAALAVLREETTGTEVVLDSRFRKLTDTPLAVCRPVGGAPSPCELREGDTLLINGDSHRVEHIKLSPPEVVLTRQDAGSTQSAPMTLRLLSDKSSPSVSAPFPPVAELTLNTK